MKNSFLTTMQQANTPCIHPWFYLWINAAGDATICPQNRTRLGSLENLSILDIWNSTKITEIREHFLHERYEEAGCERECPYLRGEYKHTPTQIPPRELIFPDFDTSTFSTQSDSYKNIAQAIDDYSNHATTLLAKPSVFDAQDILTCNADCIMCGQPHHSKLKHTNVIKYKILEASSYLSAIRWQGGEVFLDKEFIDDVTKISQNNSEIYKVIITNGSLLDKEKMDKLIASNQHIQFIVSMDGASSEVVNSIRLKLKHEKIFSTMRYLAQEQKRLKRQHLVVWNYTLMYSNIDDVCDAIKIAKEHNIDINLAAIQGKFEKENLFEYPLVSEEKWQSYLNQWKELAQNSDNIISGLEGLSHRYSSK